MEIRVRGPIVPSYVNDLKVPSLSLLTPSLSGSGASTFVKKTLESILSGPEHPAFRPIHVASVTMFPSPSDFFQTFQAEPVALT